MDMELSFEMNEEELEKLRKILTDGGVRHYILETFDNVKFDVVEFREYEKIEKENQKLKKQLDYALKLLSEIYLPCDIDGFMDNHSDYCQINCGVDEDVFKKCWLLYIEEKLKEVK